MSIDSSLLFGLVLIAAGFGLGAAAVYLLYPTRPSNGPEESMPSSAATPPREPQPAVTPEAPSAADVLPPQVPAAEIPSVPTMPAFPPEVAPPPPGPIVDTIGEPRMTEQTPPPPTTPDRRFFPVVTLLREEVTGQLALQVGTRIYQDQQALRDSPDWTRVEYATRDLARWIEGSAPAPRRTEERRPEEPAKAGTMVEEISRILETKLAAQPASGRAVRLVEGPGGAVRVYIGMQSYDLDEVPDPAIRTAIREAVAEWEARR